MTETLCLSGGRVLHPDGRIEPGEVFVAGGQFARPSATATRIDCSGCHILPGIVDVHGDAWEQVVHPRPGVDIAMPIALGAVDRQLLSHGITTAYHGLTVSWEPGARSLDAARRFMAELAALRPRLTADHRVQIRWETFAHDAIADIEGWLGSEPAPALAFNDHTTGSLAIAERAETSKVEKWAARTGLTLDAYLAELRRVGERAPDVPDRIAGLAAVGRDRGTVMLAHDERRAEDRRRHRSLGMTISEFPMTAEAAGEAASASEPVVMGGPNILRGGSHLGNLSAEDAVRSGACTAIASDYYYPSLLHAAERLVSRSVTDLATAWHLISTGPAEAMALTDRGHVAPGQRADLVVLDTNGPWRIAHTLAGGALTSFGR